MTQIQWMTPYQLEQITAWLGNLGLIVILVGWMAWFCWQGFRSDRRKDRR